MELVVAITISGVLMVGLTSTLYVASRAVNLSGPPRAALDASGAESNVLGELQYAVSFTERSNHAVEFTVADRNGDDADETIRYAWSGAAGDPLTRQYNGREPVTLVEDVQEFDLNYVIQESAETTNSVAAVDSGEVLLASFEGWTGILPNHAWKVAICSEYLVVDVPQDVTQLTITRVELQMKQLVGGFGDKLVAIHYPSSGGGPEPDLGARIGSQSVKANADLPVGGGWTEFAFSDVVIDDPPSEFCIVVDGTSVLAGSVLFYSHAGAPTDTPVGLWSSNGGATWDPSTARNQNDMLFRLYGSYQTPGTGSGGLTRYFITRVNSTLRVGSAPESRIDGGVRILNAPEVAAP
jgi:hypothetical protein